MKPIRILAGLLCGSLVTGIASAEWSGKGKIGGVIARGNSDSATGNANLDVLNELERWHHKLGGSTLRTFTEQETSADRWELRAESDYKPTRRTFLFGSMRYENDRFTDYAYQGTAAIGYGYHFIATEAIKLDGKIGAGIRRTELRVTSDTEADDIVRGSLDFEHKLTNTTLMFNRFLVEHGPANTFMQNLLGIEVKMTEALGLGLTYEVRRNTEVLPGTRNSDQVITAGLVVGF